MPIRKILARSIGTDVIVAEDIAANAITVSEISDGAVTTSKLANSAVSTDKLGDGVVTANKMASGATLANLNYTPVNRAGDTMTGELILRGNGLSSLGEPHDGYLIKSGQFNQVNPGNTGSSGSWVEYKLGPAVYKTCFSVYFGPGPANSRSYWYWTRNTGVSTWMDFMKFEMWEGNWNWGQQVGWREYYVSSASNSWSVVLGDERNHTGFGAVTMNVKVNGTTNTIIGGGNTGAANNIRYQVYSTTPLFSHNMDLVFSSTNPFV